MQDLHKTSYPFMRIAEHYGLDYGLVLDHADAMRVRYFSHLKLARRGLQKLTPLPSHVRMDIWDAVGFQQDIREGYRSMAGERIHQQATKDGVRT
jgi:hypothetical protein